MERVDVGLPEARTLRANLSVKFGNRMPFSVELPYLSANLGLENTDVFDVNFNKPFSLARGNQSTEMDISLRFPSSPTVQNAVKSFSENLYTQGWGKTTEKIALSSLKLGYSSTDYIRAFRKARLGLPTSSVLSLETVNFILNQLGFPNGVTDINDGKAMLDRIDIQGANLDFSSPGVVKMTCSVLLRRVPFNLKAFFPYFFFNLNLRGQEFMKFTILNLDVKPENANDLRSDLGIELRFTESPGLKNEVADVVDQMQKGKRVEGLFAAYGIALGPNAADSIDAFSLLVGELFIYRATNPGNSLFNDLLGSLQLNDIALAIQDEKTMVADVESTLKSPLPNIFTKIPYLYLEVLVDGKPLALLEARDVAFDNGKVLAKAFIEWPRDEATAQKAADVASNVLFRRFDAPKSVIKFSKLRFGATKETAFTFVDTTLIDFDLARLIRSVNDYVNTPGQTLELTDIQTTLTEKGVKCYITGTKLPKDIPFRSFKGAGGTAKVMWAPQGRIESYIVDVFFQNIYFAPNEVFSFELDVIVNAKEAEDAISVILPRFIQWKPYLLGVLLGHATFTSGSPYDPNSKVFRSFDKVTVVAPELFFYKPLLVEPKLLNPFTQGLGLRINLYFANPGPLHVELGNIGARVYDSSKEVGSVNIALNTKNNLEGGNRPMGNLIPIIVKIDLGLRNIINLIFNPKRYRLQWFNDRNGLSAPWLINVLNNIPEDIGSELLPIILAVLRHIEIKLGPFNIDPFPDVFNKKADKYLAMAGNNVMFGAIDAMPEAFAPMVVNATGARNVSVVANEVVTTMFVPSASVTRTTTLTSYSTATILP
ncbi:hypothetical protein BC829DRAFT_301567 [Chytridium lagenaria]|nr:hypothetical protein BC829DRAFT_301567 [Chytridium lagenaria]